MGMCVSCQSGAVPPSLASSTAKVILSDGRLREFFGTVPVKHVLENEVCPGWAVCDADGMDFDGRVSAADELRPGGLYFVLPVAMLQHPLQSEDLAALAIKASAALMQASAGGMSPRFRRRSVAPQPLVFAEAPVPTASVERPKKSASCSKSRNFASSLSVIME